MAHKHGHIPATKETDFPVSHITFRIRETKDSGNTFGLFPGDLEQSKRTVAMYSGHIDPAEMAKELRSLAAKMDQLAAKAEFQ